MVTLCCCNKPNVYEPGREWHFKVKRSNIDYNDTIKLKVLDKSFEITQTMVEYIYERVPEANGGYSKIYERTGVIDRKTNKFTQLFFDSEIWLHPPRSAYLRLSELVPFPWIKYPISIGNTTKWNLTPKSGWEELEGVKVTGKSIIKSQIFFNNPVVKDSCWVIEAFGKSSAGNYSATYYFNEKHGFVYFFYDFKKYTVELVPIKIIASRGK